MLVEFDPLSQWYDTIATIAAGWLRDGGTWSYNLTAQTPDAARARLSRLGVDVGELEGLDRLRIHDYHTLTLGQKSKERFAHDSLKVADMSIDFAKTGLVGPPMPHVLRAMDNMSVMARFNDERSWIEFMLTRALPMASIRKSVGINGIIRGLHAEWVYKQLEDANDGVIDLRLDEAGEVVRNLIRIRKMQNVGFDSRWHSLKIGQNFEVTLEM
jgi:KaiC/GvpD/RAD55 family RecA-like ATPase